MVRHTCDRHSIILLCRIAVLQKKSENDRNGNDFYAGSGVAIVKERERSKEKELHESFLNNRLGWNKIFRHPIPAHANNITYTLGGTLLVLAVVQGITGVILQQFYHPHPVSPGAYESIIEMLEAPSISLVRNLHYWGAQLMIIIALLHTVRVFISGSYKKPRELQWLAGVALLTLLFAFAFSGTVLKWDQEAVEALGHQVEVAETIGGLGSLFTSQFAANVPILVRLYAAHVTMIPILALPVAILHLALIRLLGISTPVKRIGGKGEPESLAREKVPFSTHVKRMLLYGSVAVGIAVVLSLTIPAALLMRGVEGIEITKPPWYLLWIFPLENTLGLNAIPIISVVVIALLAAVPLLDRKTETDPRRRKAIIIGMLALVSIFIGLMIAGALAPIEGHL